MNKYINLKGIFSNLINRTGGYDERLKTAIQRRLSVYEEVMELSNDLISDFLKHKIFKEYFTFFRSKKPSLGKSKLPQHICSFIDMANEIGGNSCPNQASKKLKKLFEWLIFINISVSEELELPQHISNKELLFWLFKKSFQTKDILLKLEEEPLEMKTFGEVWNMLLPKICLNQVEFQQEAPSIGILVISEWYRDFKPEILESMLKLNHGASLGMNIMHTAFNKAILAGIMIDQTSDEFFQPCRLDYLRIPKIEVFPQSMKPGKLISYFKSSTSNEECEMRHVLEKSLHIAKSGKSRNGIIVQGLPIEMLPHLIKCTRCSKLQD
jgi:hypothetical protein